MKINPYKYNPFEELSYDDIKKMSEKEFKENYLCNSEYTDELDISRLKALMNFEEY